VRSFPHFWRIPEMGPPEAVPLRAKKRRLPRGHHPTVFANFNGIFSFALELNECPAVAAMIFHHFGKIVYPFW